MATDISQTAEDKIYVNGKLAVLDMNDKWVCSEELTTEEHKALRIHLQAKGQLHG